MKRTKLGKDNQGRIMALEARLAEEISKVAAYILAIDKAWNERDDARARIKAAQDRISVYLKGGGTGPSLAIDLRNILGENSL